MLTVYFLKDLVAGKMKCKSNLADRFLTILRHVINIKCSQVSYLFAPQYTGLGIKQILAQAQDYPNVLHFLPDETDWHRLPRQWLINVFNTIVGKPFADWVSAIISERCDKLAAKHDMLIAVDSEIAQVFAASKSLSSKSFSPSQSRPLSACEPNSSYFSSERHKC